MDSNVLTRRGFSLVELSLALMIAGLLLAAILYSGQKIRAAAKAERVILELESIAAASTRYYSEHGAWPAALADLRPSYLAVGSGDLNPFGNLYTITSYASRVAVSTLLPKGLVTNRSFGSEVVVINQGANDLITITKTPESGNWRLKYEKKYIFKE